VGAAEAQGARARVEQHWFRLHVLFRYLMNEVADGVELFRRGAEECVEAAEAYLKAGDRDGCVDSLYKLLRGIDKMRERIREAVDEVANEIKSACAEGGRAEQGSPSPPA
jgi:hypothetical protein